MLPKLGKKRLLFLARGRLTAYDWHMDHVTRVTRHPADHEGIKAFADSVRANPHVPVRVLLDLIEEEFQVDSIPHVLGPERTTVVQRRLNKTFPGLELRHAELQGRLKEGRRDDLLLMAAVTAPEELTPWLQVLERGRTPVVGIHSLPLVGRQLLATLDALSPATLLVSQQSTTGLRFTFYQGRHLKMSRLARVPLETPEAFADLLLEELRQTRGYLSSLRVLPQDQPLSVVILTDAARIAVLDPQLQDGATITHRLVDVATAARKLKIKTPVTTHFSDALFIELVGRSRPANHYASPGVRRFHTTRMARIGLLAASLVATVTGVAVGGYSLHQGLSRLEQGREAQTRLLVTQNRYRQVTGMESLSDVDPTDIKRMVDLVERLEQRQATPMDPMVVVSRALDRFPDLAIHRLSWQGPDQGLSKVAKERLGKTPPPATVQGDVADAVEEVAELTGEVRQAGRNTALAQNRLNAFMEVLRQDGAVAEVTAVRMPETRTVELPRSGDALTIQVQQETPMAFVVQISFKRGPHGAGA